MWEHAAVAVAEDLGIAEAVPPLSTMIDTADELWSNFRPPSPLRHASRAPQSVLSLGRSLR